MRVARGPSAVLLSPLAWLYSLAIRLRNRYYDRSGNSADAGLPVLSVGNLTVGGTGKTPVVAWLAERLLAQGIRPAVVSRGYGGSAGRGPLLVSAGDGPLCGSAACGDEPYSLAARLRGVVVVVGSDRLAGARAAAKQGVEVVILDDGFQHRRLARDLDILLLDSTDPFAAGRLLPAGGLREPISGIGRAGIIIATRDRGEQMPAEIERAAERFNPAAPLLRSRTLAKGFVNREGANVDRPARAVLFCGIGNPGQFLRDVESLAIEVTAFRAFPDHHRYSARDLDELRQLAGDDAVLLTTEKDLARLDAAGDIPVMALRIEAEIDDEQILLDAVKKAIASQRG
jgi:tetraacyldisaccharide 4'-kinase